MSAWEVAGAVVWTPLAAFLLWNVSRLRKDRDVSDEVWLFGLSVASTASMAAAFCIARLFGAHA